MPYNYLGDLYKDEIVDRLQKRGYDVRSVHALNLIMEEMGLQVRNGRDGFVINSVSFMKGL